MASGNRRERELARRHHQRQEQRRAEERARRQQRRKLVLAVTAAVLGVVLVAGLATWFVRSRPPAETTTAGEPVASGPCTWLPDDAQGGDAVAPPPTTPGTTGTSTATVALDGLGSVELQLDAARAPCAVTSFRHLAGLGYFDGTPCHRVTRSASLKVVQCGDPGGDGTGGPGYSFADEGLEGATYPAGTLAMANSGADSNGSQFFLVYADSTLPPSYTPFGRITGGLDVLAEIGAAGVAGGGEDGKPAEPVVITSVTVQPPVGGAPSGSPAPSSVPSTAPSASAPASPRASS